MLITPVGGYQIWLTPEYLRIGIAIGHQSTDSNNARQAETDGTSDTLHCSRKPKLHTGSSEGYLTRASDISGASLVITRHADKYRWVAGTATRVLVCLGYSVILYSSSAL